MARRNLSDAGVAALKPRAARYTFPDPALPGHYVRVQPSGGKSFVAVALDPAGKQVWHTIGATAHITIDKARDAAREAIAAIKSGQDRAGPQSFQKVSDDWLKRHVVAKGLHSEKEIRRYLDKHILPAWGGRDFTSIRRGDVAKLLDSVEDNAGPVAADKVLAHLSKLCNWYASRDSDYSSPIVRGMRRSKPKERARKRALKDDELREVWQAAEANGMFGAFVRVLLLTGQRRDKVASMRWQDIVDGVWTIPAVAGEKGNAGALVLPDAVLAIIETLPRFASSPYVFSTGKGYFKGYSKGKAAFDAKVPIEPWRLHDLRRTARSLMSRAQVPPLVAELTLGHVQKGIQATYDVHEYQNEKAHALKSLASLIQNILAPASGKVVKISKRK